MSLKQESLVLFIAIITVFIAATSTTARAQKFNSSNCKSSCGTGKHANVVPYPFGFSNGCPIILKCNHTVGDVKIGEFQVQNITPNGILINIPAECDRSIETIRPLFGKNFSPSSNNSFLLQNCNSSNKLKELNWNGGLAVIVLIITAQIMRPVLKSSSGIGVLDTGVIAMMGSPEMGLWTGMVAGELRLTGGVKNLDRYASLQSILSSVVIKTHQLMRLFGVKAQPQHIAVLKVHHVVLTLNLTNHGSPSILLIVRNLIVSKCNVSKYMSGRCGGSTRVAVLVGGLIAGALLMACLALLWYYVRRKSTSLRNQSSAKRLLFEAAGNSSVPFFHYKEIEKATNGFSEKQRLGTGAYGTVYAGKLHSDDLVAIKKLRHRDTNSIDQVMNEIKLLSSVSHPNLVRLLGCCIEEGEPILVYEFMPNGTLCQHLQLERGTGLPWTIRLTVATETAKAIAYLHSAMNPPIYHRDIKSSNILLDYNYRSKVADFGLSRLGMVESSHISTAPQGTPGYLDPQYHQYFHLSDKSDVYSFGVVLIEIITALKVVDFSRPYSEVNLAALAVDRIGRGGVDEIIDPYLDPNRDAWTLTSIHTVAELAFRCLAFHRDMRPTMMEVAEELEQIMLSAWIPTMYMASPSTSSCSSEYGSQKSLSVSIGSLAGIASGKLLPPSENR
ncbi:hypothetical protein OIU77_003371 [Salix suchowensis]|uniref:Protein kinase domain-containing protein n=1 Tax=Salix suchowensis TaxID=1278906 RepID=A0ABQ9AZG1_9ROSI|nr:hypothetical protein OIU77_003371 [Salix suchowensis]